MIEREFTIKPTRSRFVRLTTLGAFGVDFWIKVNIAALFEQLSSVLLLLLLLEAIGVTMKSSAIAPCEMIALAF